MTNQRVPRPGTRVTCRNPGRPGEETSRTVTFGRAGSHAAGSQYHASAGMVGTVVVS